MSNENIEKNQERFEHKVETNNAFDAGKGLTEETVRKISEDKDEPEWMLKRRLKAFRHFKKRPMPDWGPDLSELDFEEISHYVRPDTEQSDDWDEVPEEIEETFDKLGIPEAEKEALSGVGAQFESQVVYQNMKEEWEEKGVVFCDMDKAVQEHPEKVREYFMTKCVPPQDNKFAALHGAVWSGGSFVYVPEGVEVEIPVQAYFRMNQKGMGQFEHTLIIAEENSQVHYIEGCSAPQYTQSNLHAGCVEVYVKEDAHVQYSTVQNWSKNTYNLNTKRAKVQSDGVMEWISGSMGSKVTMLYPSSHLNGEGARANHITIAYAGDGQNIDTGAKILHNAPNTKSTIESKSISQGTGRSNYRGLVRVPEGSEGSQISVECVPGSSKVQTSDGMEEIQDIELEEEVLTHRGSYEEVQAISKRDYDGKVFSVKPAGASEPLVLTPEHPVRVVERDNYPRKNEKFEAEWTKPSDIEKGDYIAIPRPKIDDCMSEEALDVEYSYYGSKKAESLAHKKSTVEKLAGYYLAEGCTSGDYRVHFSFNSDEKGMVEETVESLTDIAGDCSVREDKENCTEVYADDSMLKQFMQRFGKGNSEKRIPSGFMNEESLRKIIPRMFEGDGTFREDDNRIHYTTTSKELSEQIKLALAYFGIPANIVRRDQEGRKPAFIVNISGMSVKAFVETFDIDYQYEERNEDRRSSHVTEDEIFYPVREVKEKEFNGEVYNLDVKKESSYTVEGISVHNCDALMFSDEATSDTEPYIEIKEDDVEMAHEATVGRIGDEEIHYLMSRGIEEEEAKEMIVRGFIEPIAKELPLEYAVELNRLIELEMEGSLG